ncbi:hypothetical protein DMH18_17670 [Streptomyces sp. WAC 06783]|nr:hypothetical protein DMH18_17670 [Streptomyces sp. WAC 06783]
MPFGGRGLVCLDLHHHLGPYGKVGDRRGAGQPADGARQLATGPAALRPQQAGELMARDRPSTRAWVAGLVPVTPRTAMSSVWRRLRLSQPEAVRPAA